MSILKKYSKFYIATDIQNQYSQITTINDIKSTESKICVMIWNKGY
jgi:hypothetical protein